MIVRTLLLLSLVLQMKLNTIDASDEEDKPELMGGEGFANIVHIVALLGVLALGVLIVLAILSLAGQFDMKFVDPEA